MSLLILSLAIQIVTADFVASDPMFAYMGRFSMSNSSASFAWTGSSISFAFTGTSLTILFQSTQAQYDVIIDGTASVFKPAVSTPTKFLLASGLMDKSHTCVLRKRTEGFGNPAPVFFGVSLDSGATLLPNKARASRRIEAIGDSITCGYGVLGQVPCQFSLDTEDYFSTYTATAASHFGADINVVAWSGKGMVRNYGSPTPSSPDPMPSYYPFTLDVNQGGQTWNFSSYVPDLVLINLGTNDYSTQPAPTCSAFADGYSTLITFIRRNYGSPAQIGLICGPLIGNPCCSCVQSVVDQWKTQGDPRVHYVNLSLALVNPSDFGCDGHPNANGHQKMADKLLPAISAITGWQV